MKSISLFDLKTVEKIERLNNSRNGKLKYKFTFDDGDIWKTQPNAGWVYHISCKHLEGRPIIAKYHYTPGGKAILDGVKWWDSEKGFCALPPYLMD